MRKGTRAVVSASVFVIMIGAIILAGWPQLSSGQSDFVLYQLDVHCIPRAPAVSFTVKGSGMMGTMWHCAGACDGRIVTLDEALAKFPAGVSAALRTQADQHERNAAAGNGRSIAKCVGKDTQPPREKPPEKKCEKPNNPSNQPPWFDPFISCPTGDPQTGSISYSTQRSGYSYTISICGEPIRYTKPTLDDDFATGPSFDNTGVKSFQICCSTWREAANSNSPCDARNDIDCDGDLNQDDRSPLSATQRYARSDDWVSNAPLMNLPFWKAIFDPSSDTVICKDCKWELTEVSYTCKLDVWASGRRERIAADYSFDATWRCPSSGQTTQTKGTERKNGLQCPRRSAGRTLSWP